MNRTILIGDLHGCLNEALELLEKCEADSSDHVIFLGDLIDRGPSSVGCVDLAMQIEARQGKQACVRGNHEEKMLCYEDILAKGGKLPDQMPHTHVETRRQLRPEHYEYMRKMPTFLRIPEHNAVAVHAGVFPNRSIEDQTERHLLHVQMLNVKGGEKSLWPSRVPKEESEHWKFWTHLWNGPERIFFGHSVLTEPLITDKVVGLDGGACFGLELWAYVLPDNRLVKVKSELTGDKGRGRQPTLVHGNIAAY